MNPVPLALPYLDRADRKSVSQTSHANERAVQKFALSQINHMNERAASRIAAPVPFPCIGPSEVYVRRGVHWTPPCIPTLSNIVETLPGRVDPIGKVHEKIFDTLRSSDCEETYYRTHFDPSVYRTVHDILQAERDHGGYVPLYHGMKKSVFCFSLFTRALLQSDSPCPLIRFPRANGAKTIDAFHAVHHPEANYKDLQARLLVQSLFVPEHNIKVLVHGCGDFFSDHPADPAFREKKNALLAESRAIFASLTT